jgi:hypothetical protein
MDRQTRNDAANSRFSQFCEYAYNTNELGYTTHILKDNNSYGELYDTRKKIT